MYEYLRSSRGSRHANENELYLCTYNWAKSKVPASKIHRNSSSGIFFLDAISPIKPPRKACCRDVVSEFGQLSQRTTNYMDKLIKMPCQ